MTRSDAVNMEPHTVALTSLIVSWVDQGTDTRALPNRKPTICIKGKKKKQTNQKPFSNLSSVHPPFDVT